MPKENYSSSNDEQKDLNLTAFINALDVNEGAANHQETLEAGERDPFEPASERDSFDPNATVDYKQAGLAYPELPFADEHNQQDGGTGGFAVPGRFNPKANSGADDHGHFDDETLSDGLEPSFEDSPEEDERHLEAEKPVARSSAKRRVRKSSASDVSGASHASGSAAKGSSSRSSRASNQPSYEYNENPSSNFKPVGLQQSSYKIRGGGHKQRFKLRSPVTLLVGIIFLAAGGGIFAYAANQLSGFITTSTSATNFTLTSAQTRDAIDSSVPVLVNYINYNIEDTAAVLHETGQAIYTNDLYQHDSPDTSALGIELVSMPQLMSDEEMRAFYESSYNAYSPVDLADYFNGMYVMDIARGDLGNWNKIKYVNLNATSLEDEMTHLAALQGLSGELVTISAEGTDSRGNRVIQGQKVVEGETVLFFKIAACPFNDLYNADSLSSESVYITCTLATYDFYTGADEITPLS